MRRRRKKFDAHALAFIPDVAQIDHAAFLFFLRERIGQFEHFAVVHLVLQEQQAAVRVHHERFARFLELFPVVRPPLHLDSHTVKNSSAAPRSSCGCWHDFAHAAIFARARYSVNLALRTGVPQQQPGPKIVPKADRLPF